MSATNPGDAGRIGVRGGRHCGLVLACLHAAQSAALRHSTARAPSSTCGRSWPSGRAPAGSQGAELTRVYITQQLTTIGLTAEEQPFDRPDAARARRDGQPARRRFPGRRRRTGSIIGGHYDTKLFREFTFVGANDGGSSTAFLLELARR